MKNHGALMKRKKREKKTFPKPHMVLKFKWTIKFHNFISFSGDQSRKNTLE